MIENINKIKNCKHPYSGEINRISALIEKIFNILLIAINTIGFITAIIASTGLAEWIDEQNYDEVDIPVDFLGYLIDIESDTFGGSPFFVFLHIIIVFTLISLVTFCVKTIITANLNSKAKMLDSLYRNEKLTETLIENICNSKTE